ncbi:decaprenylphosphoryl-beta-D-ribose oxidase, partial [Nocardiopsis tropica]|nr:decaprenylphosphoryl-beta-D-ribose oxidase [Nocardiopsis tropica]
VDTDRTAGLDATLELMSRPGADRRYSVCWVDLLAAGGGMGRGVFTRADHARIGDLPSTLRREPVRHRPGTVLAAPPWAPPGLLNRGTVGAFNAAYLRAAPRRRRGEAQPLAGFFHPLDAVRGWNRMYGPRGLVQYQFVVPFGAEGTLAAVMERLSRAGAPSFLAVLKRMGEPTPGPLSFPRPGWTLAVDLPADLPGLGRLLDALDERLLEAGGRLY